MIVNNIGVKGANPVKGNLFGHTFDSLSGWTGWHSVDFGSINNSFHIGFQIT